MLLYSAWQILSGTSELLSRQRGEIFINISWSMPFPFLMFACVIQSHPNANMDLLTSWTQKVPLPELFHHISHHSCFSHFVFCFFSTAKVYPLISKLGSAITNRSFPPSLPPSFLPSLPLCLPLFATLPSCLKSWSFRLSHPPSFHSTWEKEENNHF